MSLVRFSSAFTKEFPVVYEYEQDGQLDFAVQYLIHSNLRQAVALKPWLEAQVGSIALPPDLQGAFSCDDDRAAAVQAYVIRVFQYNSDENDWSMPEYWQTAKESVSTFKGDCEDGAILQYVLLREMGVSIDRLLLFAGDVVAGPGAATAGHCCLFYKPDEYPLAWSAQDWCYYPDTRPFGQRSLYVFSGKHLDLYAPVGPSGAYVPSGESRYLSPWFYFNESRAFTSVRPLVDLSIPAPNS